MAKKKTKIEAVKSQQGKGVRFEETFDDNLLPDTAEIEKLQKIDPNIITFLKEIAKKEQEFRHSAWIKQHNLVQEAEAGNRFISKLGVICATLIVLSGMAISAFLIINKNVVTGTVLGSGVILTMFITMLSRTNSSNTKK